MRPTISAVRGWRLDELVRASTVATTNARQISDAAGKIDRALLTTGTWTGNAQRSAKRAITADADHAAEVCAVLQALASTASNANRELVPARNQLLAEVRRTVADGFDVSDTGEVSVGTDAGTTEADRADRASDAQIWENRISIALTAVATLDADYGRALAAHARDLAGMVTGQAPITLPDGSRADPDDVVTKLLAMTPAARRAYLSTLDADDIRALVTANPAAMGNLDGVPFTTRIAANDINIRTALATETAAGRGDGERARKLTEMLTPVPSTNPTFGSTTPVRRTFIAFANTKVGHTIEMVGDLNKSTPNAAVYVPGTNTNLNGSRSNYESARNLSLRTGGPVFMYLDQRLPQKLGHENLTAALGLGVINPAVGAGYAALGVKGSAVDGDLAKDIAPDLVSFGRELDTELGQVAPGAKTTYIGHSYGGLVVGTAEQLGLRADRVVYASSAGSGALGTGWHNANPNVARYSMTAPGDWIHTAQATQRYGPDPDTAPGVTRLDTGYYSPSGSGQGGLVAGPSGHGGYWNDPDSTAFANMVAVVRGDAASEYVHRADDAPPQLTAGLTAARDGSVASTAIGPAIGMEVLRRWLAGD